MPTYPDRVKKKKVKSLKIENFDQTSEKETPPNSGKFWLDPWVYTIQRFVCLNNIINRMKKSCATNMDNKSLTFQFEQMITESLIDQNYEILITGSPQQI